MNKLATLLSLVKGPTEVIDMTTKHYFCRGSNNKETGQLDNHTDTWRKVEYGEESLPEAGSPVTNITIFSLEMTTYLIFPWETLLITLTMEGRYTKQ